MLTWHFLDRRYGVRNCGSNTMQNELHMTHRGQWTQFQFSITGFESQRDRVCRSEVVLSWAFWHRGIRLLYTCFTGCLQEAMSWGVFVSPLQFLFQGITPFHFLLLLYFLLQTAVCSVNPQVLQQWLTWIDSLIHQPHVWVIPMVTVNKPLWEEAGEWGIIKSAQTDCRSSQKTSGIVLGTIYSPSLLRLTYFLRLQIAWFSASVEPCP